MEAVSGIAGGGADIVYWRSRLLSLIQFLVRLGVDRMLPANDGFCLLCCRSVFLFLYRLPVVY